LAVQKSSHSDRLLPGYFVFPSRTQKAADENRSSQKPPAAWICARTFGSQSTGHKRVTKHGKKAGPPVFTDGPAEIPLTQERGGEKLLVISY